MSINKEKDPFANRDEQYMSGEDYGALQQQKAAWNAANQAGDTAGAQAAHDAGEQLRKNYGYSGGADGSQYTPLPKQQAEKFSYGSAPSSYTSPYQKQLDALMNGLMNRPDFSYDYTQDPLYAQYEKSYTKNGQRAMQDTLGQVSARTGGIASSYATIAGQQSYDGYMDALSAKIPELQQLAYSMYRDEGSDQRANLELLSALEAGDYQKYQDILNQYNSDRNFEYGKFHDEQTTDYNAEQDAKKWAWDEDGRNDDREQLALENEQYSDKITYGKEQDALDRADEENDKAHKNGLDEFDKAMQKWQITGILDAAGSQIIGIPAGTPYSQAQDAPSGTRSGGGGSGGAEEEAEQAGGRSAEEAKPYAPRLSKAAAKYQMERGIGGDSARQDYEYYFGKKFEGGGTAPASGGTANRVTNKVETQPNGDEWIDVPGFSGVTWSKLEFKVNSGEILEYVNEKDGTITYKKNPATKP